MAIDQYERLRRGSVATLPDVAVKETRGREAITTVGLGWRSTAGRYLRSRHTWGLDANLETDQADDLTASDTGNRITGDDTLATAGTQTGTLVSQANLDGTGTSTGPSITG